MPKERASFFQGTQDIDLSAFSPKSQEESRAPAPEKVKASKTGSCGQSCSNRLKYCATRTWKA
jgi:hypothetical protein